MNRHEKNPIIVPSDVKPSKEYLKIDGVFNAGACKFNNETILLLRIAESNNETKDGFVSIPVMKEDGLVSIDISLDDPRYDFSDSRAVKIKGTNRTEYLTSISHIRIARSTNGVDFQIDDTPIKVDYSIDEEWGLEDPRVTKIDDTYYINYTGVSRYGAATNMISTTDFKEFKRHGMIFLPENKDVCIFPEKINGMYYAYNRPVPKAFGNPDIWVASSHDLNHWGKYKHVLGVTDADSWDNGRIGGGAPPIKTGQGWLSIYHAADANDVYHLGAFLSPLDDPSKIIKKSATPILSPTTQYEKEGFFGNVVFTCGVVEQDDELYVYYGAADDKMALVTYSLEEIFKSMEDYSNV